MDQFVRCRCPACTKKLKVPDDFADELVVGCTRCRYPFTVAQLKLAAELQDASQAKNSLGHGKLPKADTSPVADLNLEQLTPPPFATTANGLCKKSLCTDSHTTAIEPPAGQDRAATAGVLTAELVDIVTNTARFTWRLTEYLLGHVLPYGMEKFSHLSKRAMAAAKPWPLVKRICFASCVAGLLFVVAHSQFSDESETTPELHALTVLEQQLVKQGIDDLSWKEKQSTKSKNKVVKQPQSNSKDSIVAKIKQTSQPTVAVEDTDKTHAKKQTSSRKQQGPPSVSSLFSKSKNRVVQFYNQHHVPQRFPPRSSRSTYRRSLDQQRRWHAAEREAQYEVDRTMQQFREQTATQTPWLYWE